MFEAEKNNPELVSKIDIDELLRASENVDMNYFMNNTLETISSEIVEVLREHGITDTALANFCEKLVGFRFVDQIYQLHKGKHVRWIRISNAKTSVMRDGVLTNGRQNGVLTNGRQNGVLTNGRQNGVLTNGRQNGVLTNGRQNGVLTNGRQNGVLTNGGIVVDVKFLDNGTQVLCKNKNRFIQYKFDDCLTFQRLSSDELLVLTCMNNATLSR